MVLAGPKPVREESCTGEGTVKVEVGLAGDKNEPHPSEAGNQCIERNYAAASSGLDKPWTVFIYIGLFIF